MVLGNFAFILHVLFRLKESYENGAPQVVRQAAYAHFYPSLQQSVLSPSGRAATLVSPRACPQHCVVSRRPSSGAAFHSDHRQLQSLSQRTTDLWLFYCRSACNSLSSFYWSQWIHIARGCTGWKCTSRPEYQADFLLTFRMVGQIYSLDCI